MKARKTEYQREREQLLIQIVRTAIEFRSVEIPYMRGSASRIYREAKKRFPNGGLMRVSKRMLMNVLEDEFMKEEERFLRS